MVCISGLETDRRYKMAEVYLTIHEKIFNDPVAKKLAKEAAFKAYGNEAEDELVFDNIDLEENDFEFNKDTGKLTINGNLTNLTKDFGWIDISINLDMDLAVEIIEMYMKKLGKLKTVLEATK